MIPDSYQIDPQSPTPRPSLVGNLSPVARLAVPRVTAQLEDAGLHVVAAPPYGFGQRLDLPAPFEGFDGLIREVPGLVVDEDLVSPRLVLFGPLRLTGTGVGDHYALARS